MEETVERALAEDLGPGDVTSKIVVPADATARARIEQKGPGVIAGLDVARETFRQVDSSLSFEVWTHEGEWRDHGPVARIEGSARSILAAERVALNFLGRLSGVATMAARYVQAVEGTRARILDTRKTTPGLRELEKQAVRVGGAFNHRFGLFDAILVKENHSALAGGVAQATALAVDRAPSSMLVVVECQTLAEVDEALGAGATHILADNMQLDELRETVERSAGRASVEASGGVDLDTVRGIAETGVDYISVGALTHSAPAVDLSLLLYT
ncbi:MAG: carboxylating nicotinate-nucleotide diphosphorylase [Thermoleophilaceae bacterium]